MNDAFFVAVLELGQTGVSGAVHNPRILQYFHDIGHKWVKDDETAWCAAFLNWCLLQAGYKHTGKLNARSFLDYGKPTQEPKAGDIAVLWRISPSSIYGHVGFYLFHDKTHVYLLGGNQKNAVSAQKFTLSQVLTYRELPDK